MKIFLILLALLAILCISVGIFALFIPAALLLVIFWCAIKIAIFSTSLRRAGRRHHRQSQK